MNKLSAAALMVLLVAFAIGSMEAQGLPSTAGDSAAADRIQALAPYPSPLRGIPRLLTSYLDTADQPSFVAARRLLNAGSSIDNSGTNAPDGVCRLHTCLAPMSDYPRTECKPRTMTGLCMLHARSGHAYA